MKAKDLSTHPPIICLVGPAGCGKTALCSQAGGGYLFDFDDGMRTALNLKDQFTSYRQQIEFDTYRDMDIRKPNAWLNAKNKLMQFVNTADPVKHLVYDDKKTSFDSVVVDSLTGACQSIRYFVMNTEGGGPLNTPQIQHWGSMVKELDQFLCMLRSLPVVKIVAAHDNFADVNDSIKHIINSMTKNHGMNNVSWMFDEVLYMQIKPAGEGKRKFIVTGKGAGLPVRTRSAIFDDVDITTIGLVGFLEKCGYVYNQKIVSH